MSEILCKEQLNVIIEHHPFYKSINEKLIEECKNFTFTRDIINSDGGPSNVRALQTFNDIESPTFSLIDNWILSILEGKYGFNCSIDVRWISHYNKGDYTMRHEHLGATFAFNYFIKTPAGSSPLIFSTSGKKIKAEEGKLVIFHGNVLHHVPKNKCDGRITMAGNITPTIQ